MFIADPSCTIVPGSCEFYKNCVDHNIPCGDSGYATSYAYPFCSSYLNNINSFSSAGKQVKLFTLLPIIHEFVSGFKTSSYASRTLCFRSPLHLLRPLATNYRMMHLLHMYHATLMRPATFASFRFLIWGKSFPLSGGDCSHQQLHYLKPS